MIWISINIFCVNNNGLRIRDYLRMTSIQRRIKMCDELLKFYQPLINSRRFGKNRPIAFFRCNFQDAMINSLSPVRRGAKCFLSLVRCFSLSPADSSSRFFTCRTMYTRVTRSGVTRRGEPARRRTCSLHLRVASPRCPVTGFALCSVKTCRWMRCLAENDGIGCTSLRLHVYFFVYSFYFF